MYKFSECVSPGHPDKCADYISEYILDKYIERDPNVRYAVEVLIKGNVVHLAGEVTSKVYLGYHEYKGFVQEALREIGYTEEYYKAWGGKVINPEDIELQVDITAQSPEIGQGVKNNGWGDQGIFFGYADPNEDFMAPRSHSLAKNLCHMLYEQAKEEKIGGIDIKTELILDEDGTIKKIIAAVPCRTDAEYDMVIESIYDWYDEIETNRSVKWPQVILNGTGNYVMHGPVADCGVTGRKLAVDFYGGEFQVGGGSPWTKDGSKADLTLNLFARNLAIHYANKESVPIKVSIACCIGESEINYSIDTFDERNIKTGSINVCPKDLISLYELDKPIFRKMCTFGLFGEFQKEMKWESDNIPILE